MTIAAISLGILGLLCTARGTAGFTLALRAARRTAALTAITWQTRLWLRFGKPSAQSLLALFFAMLIATHLISAARRRPMSYSRTASDSAPASDSAAGTVIRAAVHDDAAWRASVERRIVAMAEQIGSLKNALADANVRSREESTQTAQRRDNDDLRSFGWVGLGIVFQVAASILTLFAH